ncbi:MAG: hypothetical protein LBE57_02790 [Methanosarcinales archaeon]|jgi:uncharacterized membrane protein YjjP (DUF1212 family)|nr:hypothetical protein [Methanosarcinales archaeon]
MKILIDLIGGVVSGVLTLLVMILLLGIELTAYQGGIFIAIIVIISAIIDVIVGAIVGAITAIIKKKASMKFLIDLIGAFVAGALASAAIVLLGIDLVDNQSAILIVSIIIILAIVGAITDEIKEKIDKKKRAI